MQKPIVISLGGSMLYDEKGNFDLKYIEGFSDMVLRLRKQNVPVIIAVGGGASAAQYCDAVRKLKGSEFLGDRIAIMATRMNALLLISILGEEAYQKVITDLDEAVNVLEMGMIPIAGGMIEGVTTDTVSMLLAELSQAKALVNVSKIDAIYSSDPKKDKNAKKFSKMTHKELSDIAVEQDKRVARTNFPFDMLACKLAQRSNVEIRFVYGKDLSEVEEAIIGHDFKGTIVRD